MEIPKTLTLVPVSSPEGSVDLVNEYGVLLFNTLQQKKGFFEHYDGHNVVLVECGVPTIKSIASFSGYIVPCSSPSDLLDILRGIPNDKDEEISNRHLNTLVVENISAFFWNLASLTSHEKFLWYRTLNNELALLRKKYGCNVLVTGWDVDFDRGFNARSVVGKTAVVLDDLTYLPGELFQGAARIIHYGEECLELKDKKWIKME